MAKDFDWQQFGRNVRNQKRFATDITDVANFMMRVDGEAVNGRIAGKLSTQELASAIDVSIIQANSVIGPTRIYCSLTGQPIGTRGADNIKLALQIHGVSKYEELVKFNVQTAVAEHWQATAGRDLSKLAEADPYGYFVYAASKAYVRYYKNLVEKKENDTAEAQLQLVKQRIDLWQRVSAYDLETVVRANEAWRNFLSLIDPAYARTLVVFPCHVLADFAKQEVMDFLQYQLSKTLAEIVYKETKYRGRVSVADITRIGDKFHGLSSFRAQQRITGEDDGDLIARLIAENVSPLVPVSAADKSHGSSWQRRAENQAPKRSRGPQYQGQSYTVQPGSNFKLKVSDETLPIQAKTVKQEIVLPREAEAKKPTMLDVFKQFKRKE